MKIRNFRDLRVQDTLYIDPRELIEYLGTLEERLIQFHDRVVALEHRLSDMERGR